MKTNKKANKKVSKDAVIILLSILAVICGCGVVDDMVSNPNPLNVGIFAVSFVYLLLVTIANSL